MTLLGELLVGYGEKNGKEEGLEIGIKAFILEYLDNDMPKEHILDRLVWQSGANRYSPPAPFALSFTLKVLPSGQTDCVLAREDGWTFGNQDGMSK